MSRHEQMEQFVNGYKTYRRSRKSKFEKLLLPWFLIVLFGTTIVGTYMQQQRDPGADAVFTIGAVAGIFVVGWIAIDLVAFAKSRVR
jgi:hypothetical protein